VVQEEAGLPRRAFALLAMTVETLALIGVAQRNDGVITNCCG